MKGAPKEIPGNYFPTGQFFLVALMMKGVNSPASDAARSARAVGHEAQLYCCPNYHVSINSLLKHGGLGAPAGDAPHNSEETTANSFPETFLMEK